MCLALPMRITAIDGQLATIVAEGLEQRASHRRSSPTREIGDYVLVHAGYAISVIDEDEAEETYALLAELAERPRGRTRATGAPRRRNASTGTGRRRTRDAAGRRRGAGGPRRLADELAAEASAALAAGAGRSHLHGGLRHAHHGDRALRPARPAAARACASSRGPAVPSASRRWATSTGSIALARLPEVTLTRSATWCACRRRARRSPPSAPPAPTCAWSTRRATPSRSRRPSPSARSSSPASASRPRRPRSPPRCSTRRRAASPTSRVLSLHKTMPLPLQGAARARRDRDDRLHPAGPRERRDRLGRATSSWPDEHGVGGVVAGFEAHDVLRRCCCSCARPSRRSRSSTGAPCTPRATSWRGRLMEQVFEPGDADWRGIGVIPGSGLRVRERVRRLRRARRFAVDPGEPLEPRAAAAARCCAASSTRPSARCSARAARPRIPSAPAWSPARGLCGALPLPGDR